MKYSLISILTLGIAAGGLASCSPVKNLSKLNSNDWKMFNIRDLRTDAPPIVQVRPRDLKTQKTGEEHILAWTRSLRSSNNALGSPNGAFFMPEDYDPSSLSDDGMISSYGVLPSLQPGGSPDAEVREEQGTLPGEAPQLPKIN